MAKPTCEDDVRCTFVIRRLRFNKLKTRSPDGAKRNPGPPFRLYPDFASLHPGYFLAPNRSYDDRTPHHPASFRKVAVLGKGTRRLRPEEHRVDIRPYLPNHAASRLDAADRRLSAHAGDADRCRHLLRHAMHHPRAGTAVSGTNPVSRRI